MQIAEAEKVIKKLRLDKAEKALIINTPVELTNVFATITHDTKPIASEAEYDFVMLFATAQSELEKTCKEVVKAGKKDCLFWACYPKISGKIKSDIKRETVWIAFEQVGLDTVTSISIDETWTALRARPFDMVGKK